VKKSIAKKSLEMTGFFEAEVFVRLLLWRWNHPFADDSEFADGLLEAASSALRSACQGHEMIEGIPPSSMNFVAAVWYAEQCALASEEPEAQERRTRQKWLSAVRRALPSCFCDPSALPDD